MHGRSYSIYHVVDVLLVSQYNYITGVHLQNLTGRSTITCSFKVGGCGGGVDLSPSLPSSQPTPTLPLSLLLYAPLPLSLNPLSLSLIITLFQKSTNLYKNVSTSSTTSTVVHRFCLYSNRRRRHPIRDFYHTPLPATHILWSQHTSGPSRLGKHLILLFDIVAGYTYSHTPIDIRRIDLSCLDVKYRLFYNIDRIVIIYSVDVPRDNVRHPGPNGHVGFLVRGF